MSKQRTYFGGMPTDVDVRILREAFGVPAEGAEIAYADVADRIKAPVGSARFRTVTTRWRKQLQQDNDCFLVARNGAFRAATPSERLDVGEGKLRSGIRGIRRGGSIIDSTDRSRLTEDERKRADHGSGVRTTMLQAGRLEAKRPRLSLPSGVAAGA